MLHDWAVIAAAFGYIGFLFFVASYGDRLSPTQRGRASALIYPLSLAIYCTSWTFFGSVGFASRTSVDFLAIYVGPILMIGLATPLLRRVIKLAKSQNITSIADFIGARYGKSQAVAATVALIAIIGSVPYIALQLKAVASSLETILSEDQAISHIPILGDIALIVTLAMATFAVLFGTRQSDATEHQHGLMLAVATESIVKLVAFITAGAFVTFWMFTPHELIDRAKRKGDEPGERDRDHEQVDRHEIKREQPARTAHFGVAGVLHHADVKLARQQHDRAKRQQHHGEKIADRRRVVDGAYRFGRFHRALDQFDRREHPECDECAGGNKRDQFDDGFGRDRQHQAMLVFGRVGLAGSEQYRERRHRQRSGQRDIPDDRN